MKIVGMLEFRKDAEGIMRRAMRGERVILSYRGRPVLRLEPLSRDRAASDDPFFSLPDMADAKGLPLSNRQMDEAVYGR
jgi:prevent-host-death family protein